MLFFSSSGSDVVDWLYHHVEGFTDRREARKYASNLLKAGYIRHTVNKITFSEQCYYIFGDLCGSKFQILAFPIKSPHFPHVFFQVSFIDPFPFCMFLYLRYGQSHLA